MSLCIQKNKGNEPQINALEQILLFVKFKQRKLSDTKRNVSTFLAISKPTDRQFKTPSLALTLDIMSVIGIYFYIKLVKIKAQ